MKLSNLQKRLRESKQYLPAEDTFFLADIIQNENGDTALDIGCGSGYLTDILKSTFLSMIVAFVGICIMIMHDSISGSVLGAFFGFLSATGFALYTVTIRWKPETPKFTTVVLAGLFCTFFSFIFMTTSFFLSLPNPKAKYPSDVTFTFFLSIKTSEPGSVFPRINEP